MGGRVCQRNVECKIFIWGAYDYGGDASVVGVKKKFLVLHG